MKLIYCDKCKKDLCAVEIPDDVQFRCSVCGHVGFQNSSRDDHIQVQSAWWSLWLGLASIVLIFFTGIPAVYLGIKALLKMRYQKVTNLTRFAAVGGVAIGGVWGVMCGGGLFVTVGFGGFDGCNEWHPED